MKQKYIGRLFLVGLLVSCLLFTSSCGIPSEIEFYSSSDNYITATGTVEDYGYSKGGDRIYFRFSELTPKFDDRKFDIEGKNVSIVVENGIFEKLEIGDTVEIISANGCFYDGYTFPIVGLEVDGEVLLSFEDGFQNLMDEFSSRSFIDFLVCLPQTSQR